MHHEMSFAVAQETSLGITIKSSKELARMRQAGRIVALTIKALRRALRPGMRTRELDAIAEQEIARLGGRPAFKGYRGFPATICVSVNEEIVHGIPGDRMVREGDIVSLDVGAIVDGFYGDAAVTLAVGEVPVAVRRLLEVTEGALYAGIGAARAGARVGDVSAAVERFVASQGEYGVVRQYVGHGIGRALHEDPQVPNYGPPGRGPLLRPGMTIAIEPMVNLGTWETRVLGDNWTVVTADGSLSAHFEHTIAIAEGESQVLTVP